MFVSAMIPPIVDGDATILDMDDTLSIVCYWVIPYTVLGIAGAISAVFPPWFDKRSAEVDKRMPRPPAVVTATGTAAGEPVSTDRRAEHRGACRQPARRTVHRDDHRRPGRLDRRGDHLRQLDLFGRRWRSRAAFTVPTDGVVDLATLAPHGIDGQDPDWTAADGDAADLGDASSTTTTPPRRCSSRRPNPGS